MTWMRDTANYIITTCNCKIIGYDKGIERGLNFEHFLAHEIEESKSTLYCTTPSEVISLERISGHCSEFAIYTGLHREKVTKGYWSQFCSVIHLKHLQAFILILSGDMRSNIMQRFHWKMYPSLKVNTLIQVKRHLLFEDEGLCDKLEM